ncbi:hypothetical protein WH297_03530 [Ochrobactrum vermis]|uniref:Uncharacterized protein n=1 Tax=Ochrobactrum vermis TaxID=1827297 RepID=A0ABU8P987_9HYPH
MLGEHIRRKFSPPQSPPLTSNQSASQRPRQSELPLQELAKTKRLNTALSGPLSIPETEHMIRYAYS